MRSAVTGMEPETIGFRVVDIYPVLNVEQQRLYEELHADEKQLLGLKAAGYTMTEASTLFSACRGTLYLRLYELRKFLRGEPTRFSVGRPIRTGENRGVRTDKKLTKKQVLEIRAAHENGMGRRRLAKQYGVSTGCIHKIFHRITWNDV